MGRVKSCSFHVGVMTDLYIERLKVTSDPNCQADFRECVLGYLLPVSSLLRFELTVDELYRFKNDDLDWKVPVKLQLYQTRKFCEKFSDYYQTVLDE